MTAPGAVLGPDEVLLTDAGLETDLVFHGGFDLPEFAAYPLLDDPAGRAAMRRYYADHAAIAEQSGFAMVLETPTWRAGREWGERLGHDAAALARLTRDAVTLVEDVRTGSSAQLVVSGCLGPRGDGYVAGAGMTPRQAADHHAPQVEVFAGTSVDLVSVLTVTYPEEGAGVVLAAQRAGLPVVASFTVETDGRLPDGTSLGDAVRRADDLTGGYAAHYLVNCAHPEHLAAAVDAEADWWSRVRGLRANASRKSHAELDDSDVLDEGDPVELAGQLAALHREAGLTVLGGCCGTDARHVDALARALRPLVADQPAPAGDSARSRRPSRTPGAADGTPR